jgi:hypothetical protein
LGDRRGEGRVLPATWREFVLRCALVIALLFGVDAFARATVPLDSLRYDESYRLSEADSLEALPDYVDHIRAMRRRYPNDRIVVFLGASPTYGVGIRDPRNTFPAALASAAASDATTPGQRVRVFNLASNGLLIADQYYIAQAIGDAADAFYVQLTYQTFDPGPLASVPIRYPELPRRLGVSVTAEDARTLGLERHTSTSLDRGIASAVRSNWFALRAKDRLASRLLGESPERRLYAIAAGGAAVDTADAGAAAASGPEQTTPSTTPFDELDPALQMVAIARASENSRFALRKDNSELVMLKRLAGFLKSRDRHAVFFFAPMNEEILSAYEALDEKAYSKNTQKVRTAIEAVGFPLLDYHSKPFLSSADFVDLTHTTDEGGRLTGERLWTDTRAYLRGDAPR